MIKVAFLISIAGLIIGIVFLNYSYYYVWDEYIFHLMYFLYSVILIVFVSMISSLWNIFFKRCDLLLSIFSILIGSIAIYTMAHAISRLIFDY